MNGVIELRDLRCLVIVGTLPEERVTPQPLSLDIDLFRKITRAARHDDLRATTNYADVLALALRVASDGRFQLLETLAARVARSILEQHRELTSVGVLVRKLAPPVAEIVSSVGVRVVLQQKK